MPYVRRRDADAAAQGSSGYSVTASFRDDWPVCSPASPTNSDPGQCGPTFTEQFNSYSLTSTIDIPAQCCGSECAAPPPTPGAPTPTPVPAPPSAGSWTNSCSQTFWDGTTLCASCIANGACVPATCVSNCDGEVSNLDGVLTCGS